MNLRSNLKLNCCYHSYYSVFNCSNFVKTCSISNVCGHTSTSLMPINNTETAVLNTINLKTINTYSNNLVSTFLNPSSLKDSNECIAFESTVNAISVPPKIWRPKQKTNYKPMICTDVDEDLYIFNPFGKSMKRAESWTPRPRSDVIPWNTSLFQEELDNNFNIGSMTDESTRNAVIQIIKDNWD